MLTIERMWVAIGLIGQGVFTARFLVQWFQSERQGKSVIPVAFWYLSIAGSLILLSYAVWRKDPVFILGQSTGLFIYLRNLHFINRDKRKEALEE